MFQEGIARCAEKLGPSPRQFWWWDRIYWRFARPIWLVEDPDDQLETLFQNLDNLRRDGKVVWGHIIQANGILYAPGDDNCPGEVVYSLDDANPLDAKELASIAARLFSLKNTKPDNPELAAIADYLTNERIRVFGKPVPAMVSPRMRYLISTVFFVRKHLPEPARSLRQSLLPILVHPVPPHVALVLPCRYWPQSLIDWWRRGQRGVSP